MQSNAISLILTAVTATASALAGALCTYYLYAFIQFSQKRKIPTTWKEVGTLKDILIYPIKSCAPVRKTRAECTSIGLKDDWLRDRVLMVVDDKYNFITARAYPKLLLIQSAIEKSVLTLTCDDMEPLSLDLAEIIASKKPMVAKLWGEKIPVYDCNREPSEWLTRLLTQYRRTFRLVFYAAKPKRFGTYVYKKMNTTAQKGVFSDELPFNLINEASLNDLNDRLNEIKVTHTQFRTNLLLTGAKPYEEDDWTFIKIGENIFEIIKPCIRCVMTTLDPKTGTRNPTAEPLVTLKSYRQVTEPEMRKSAGSSPRMGVQMRLRSREGGFVSINDRIYAA